MMSVYTSAEVQVRGTIARAVFLELSRLHLSPIVAVYPLGEGQLRVDVQIGWRAWVPWIKSRVEEEVEDVCRFERPIGIECLVRVRR